MAVLKVMDQYVSEEEKQDIGANLPKSFAVLFR
jgi:hypothetical protein